MSLLLIDGFDTYGTTIGAAPSPAGIVGRRYDVPGLSGYTIRAGRITAYALELNTMYGSLGAYSYTQNDTVVLGFAARFTLWDNDRRFCSLLDGSTQGINLHINTSGEITIKRGSTTLATSTGAGIALNAWNYIELKVKCGAAGTFELHVNGINVCSGAGNTQIGSHAYYDGFSLTGGSFHHVQIDDLYFLDGSGEVNNDFCGNVRVDTMFPDAPGDSSDFTPDSGVNYERVNEAVSLTDGSYVESDTPGAVDLYNYGGVPFAENVFLAAQITTECRETDAKSFNIVTTCKSGETVSDDDGQAVGATSFVLKRRILEIDPNTNSPWTTDTLNTAQFGIKVG